MEACIIFQGGAINPAVGKYNEGVIASVNVGIDLLRKGGKALDAVVEAIKLAEDNPIFNAGRGAYMNLRGEVELDASIMDGSSLSGAGVGCITDVRHPILVAKKIMEETDHVLLVGKGAVDFARKCGFQEYNTILPERREEWMNLMAKIKAGDQLPSIYKYWRKIKKWADTVGAVAVDRDGNIAAGTSTGGFPLKMPGRVGGAAIIGASTYAENSAGGVSISGQGEIIIKTCLAKSIAEMMKSGNSAQKAVETAINYVNKEFDNPLMAIIAIDSNGKIGAARNVDLSPHAYITESMYEPKSNFAPIIR